MNLKLDFIFTFHPFFSDAPQHTSGLTQSDLATLSGINIKSISAYEQEPTKINKASVITLFILSESLNCSIEDLIEKDYIRESLT